LDYAYSLFKGVSSVLPFLHNDSIARTGLHPILGHVQGRKIKLTPASCLGLRLDLEEVEKAAQLVGHSLLLGESEVKVLSYRVKNLIPSNTLYSRLVIIKGFMEPATFMVAAKRQLAQHNIQSDPILLKTPTGEYVRRTIEIHGKKIVGFAMGFTKLTDKDSLNIQSIGIGGRRHFGCGVFVSP
jgi:CRISPR-associated endonuclease/helicase Cas3